MNKQYVLASNADDSEAQSKLFGLPRPLAGVLIGVLMFLLILLPLKFLNYNSKLLYDLALDLEVPGRMTILVLGMTAGLNLPKTLLDVLSITISAIPAGIAGRLISSLNKSTRTMGIVFSLIYFCFLLLFGSLLAFLGI